MATDAGTSEDRSASESIPHETVEAALDEALNGDSADEADVRSLFSDN